MTDSDSSDIEEWNGQMDPRRGLSIDSHHRKPSVKPKKPAKPTTKVKGEAKQRRPSGSKEKKSSKKSDVKSSAGSSARSEGEPAAGDMRRTSDGKV